MAFTPSTLSLRNQLIAGKRRVWDYLTTDSLATVLGAGYFTLCTRKKLVAGDIIVMQKTDDTPPTNTTLRLDSITSDNGTAKASSSTDTVGFYGVTPTAQPSVVAAVATTGVVTTGFGFSTTAQGNALVAAVNSILSTLKTLGLMATT